MALAYSMDKIGPMCRSAEDCDLVLQAIAGHDAQDAGSLPDPAAQYSGVRKATMPLRLGWMTNAWKEISPEVAGPVNEARKVLESEPSLVVKNVALPEGPWEAAAGVTVSVEGATAFRSLIQSGQVAQLNDPLGKIGGYMNEEISASDYMVAQRIRSILQKKMDEIFQQVDVLVAAALPVTATRLDANLDDALSFPDPIGGIGNFCGLPAISVPCGFAKNNLPAGLQFVGRPLGDAQAVQAAKLFQSRTNWHKQRPRLT
jgi:aspartyl-tRNA(Asn)/glutamyl-tRNA(Gln) amidotransferase subunit A